MRVLVTGGNGFLGSHICETLLAHGHTVRLLLRRTSSTAFIRELDYERADGDVRDSASLRAACEGVDAVIHAAALTTALSERDFAAVNAQGTVALLDAAVAAGVTRFLYVSSMAAGTWTEPNGTTAGPGTAYGRSKLAGEQATLARYDRLEALSLRPPVIYGPRDKALLNFFRFIRWGVMPLYADGSNSISWVHVQDAADAIVAAVEAGRAGAVYEIADGEPHTWRELAELLAEAQGRRARMVSVPPWAFAGAGYGAAAASALLRRPLPLSPDRVRQMGRKAWAASNDRITADLGWTPRIEPRAGVAHTLRWYREQHWL